jgi:hypothetical protein
MKLLLEFKDYSELQFIQELVEEIFYSIFDESRKPKVHSSIINLVESEIVCHDIIKTDSSSDIEFRSFLVDFTGRIDSEEFEEIFKRIEVALSSELNEKIKCVALQRFPINEFIICNANEYSILESISEFEYSIEDEICEIKDNEYTSVIDLTADDYSNKKKSLKIWLREYSSKFGINLNLNRNMVESDSLNYKITTSFFFKTPTEYLQYLQQDFTTLSWVKKNLPTTGSEDLLSKLKNIETKINSLNLTFDLDLDSDSNEEAKRFINMIREKVFPIFVNEESKKISSLYEQFRKLSQYNIDAEWQHQGNYFYLFDINYKKRNYILHVKYDLKSDLVKIELRDKKIVEEVPISEFCNTIYLLVEEN